MLRRPAVHRCPRALRPSNQPSATSKPRTTKQTQPLRTAVKSISYNAVPLPPPAAPPRFQGEAWRPASVARASKRPAASPGPANHQSPRSRPACRQPPTRPQPQNAKIELPNRPISPNPIEISVLVSTRHRPPAVPQKTPPSQIRQTGLPNRPNCTRSRDFPPHKSPTQPLASPPRTVTHLRVLTPSTTAKRPSRRK